MTLEESLTHTDQGFITGSTCMMAHGHREEYEFHYFPKADCLFTNDSRRCHLPDHSLTFSFPRTQHGILEVKAGATVQWYFFRFKLHQAERKTVQRISQAFRERGFIRMGPPAQVQFREMVNRLNSGDPQLRQSGKYRFLSFLSEIGATGGETVFSQAPKHVDDILRKMQENVEGQIRLDDLARETGIEKSYLIRLFKKKIGLPPVKYFNKLKVDTASHLLTHTGLPLRDIAQRLGFCDEFYFSRVFKQHTGLSPALHRKRNTLAG